MIIEALCNLLFLILNGIISLFPSGFTLPDWGVAFFNLLQKALFFFPPDVLVTVISVVVGSYSSQFVWAIIEWCYKKFPGIE